MATEEFNCEAASGESGERLVARAYDVARLPLTLLIDADGTIRAAWSGIAPKLAELDPHIQRLRQD